MGSLHRSSQMAALLHAQRIAAPALSGGDAGRSARPVPRHVVALLLRNLERLTSLFQTWHAQKDDTRVRRREFNKACRLIGIDVPKVDVARLFETLDPERTGTIDYRHLHRALKSAAYVPPGADAPFEVRLPPLENDIPVDEIDDLVTRHVDAGEYPEALQLLRYKLELLPRGDSDEAVRTTNARMAGVCNAIGMAHLRADEHRGALSYLRQAEWLSADDGPMLSATLNCLASYYRRRGKLRMALSALLRALEVERRCEKRCERRSESAPDQTFLHTPADTHMNISHLFAEMDDHHQAMHHAHAALALLEAELGPALKYWVRGSTGDLSAAASRSRAGSVAPPKPAQPLSAPERGSRLAVYVAAVHNLAVEEEALGHKARALEHYERAADLARDMCLRRALEHYKGEADLPHEMRHVSDDADDAERADAGTLELCAAIASAFTSARRRLAPPKPPKPSLAPATQRSLGSNASRIWRSSSAPRPSTSAGRARADPAACRLYTSRPSPSFCVMRERTLESVRRHVELASSGRSFRMSASKAFGSLDPPPALRPL